MQLGSESLSPGLQSLPRCSLTGKRAESETGLLCVSSYKALIPFMRALPFWHEHPSRAPSPNTITFGHRISTYDFDSDTNVKSIILGIFLVLLKFWVLVRKLSMIFWKNLKHDLHYRL